MSYEAEGIFAEGFTKEEVMSILEKAKALFLKDGGSQIVSWSSSGSSATNRTPLTASELIQECMYALKILDPVNYPGNQLPDTVIASFSSPLQ